MSEKSEGACSSSIGLSSASPIEPLRVSPLRASIPSASMIPETWFRAQSRSTTMAFISAKHQGRDYPLQAGERQLGWFVLPPFQRPPVWTLAQQVRFVESCWLGLPIGVFVYNRTIKDGPFDSWLLDGQQRVTSVLSYIDDGFPVFGHYFSELPPRDLRKWGMSVAFPCLETNMEDEAALRDVYDRLAYGGTPHAQVDRNPEGEDPQGLRAKPESAVAESDAPQLNPETNHD